MGTRDAARALLKAADAATAPNPAPAGPPERPAPRPAVQAAAKSAAQTIHQVRSTTAGVRQGTRRFGEALWGPFVKVSAIVWLEVMGVLFSLFALVSGVEVWNHRADLHGDGTARGHLLVAVVMFLVFGYFTISSFLRASRRNSR